MLSLTTIYIRKSQEQLREWQGERGSVQSNCPRLFTRSPQTAITRCHRWCGSNSNFSQLSRLEVQNQGTSWFSPLISVLFWFCKWPLSCCILTWGERDWKLSGVTSCKDTNPVMRISPSWHPLNLITTQRPHFQPPSH